MKRLEPHSAVERVARAITEASLMRPGTADSNVNAIWLGQMSRARAAIEALKNPSEFVMDAFRSAGVNEWNDALDRLLAEGRE